MIRNIFRQSFKLNSLSAKGYLPQAGRIENTLQNLAPRGKYEGGRDSGNFVIAALYISLCCASLSSNEASHCQEEVENNDPSNSNQRYYRLSEIAKHANSSSVWIIHNGNVYDVTKFLPNHPGGADKLMLAAGRSVEPFWNVYRQHYNSPLPLELLKNMQIGKVHPDDLATIKNSQSSASSADSPYKDDPVLSPVLQFLSKEPINAEAPAALLGDHWLTPTHLWFVRNHHPVPNITVPEDFTLSIALEKEGQGAEVVKKLSLAELTALAPVRNVVTTVQCGGNRRQEMTQLERTNGSNWQVSAISTAKWTGVRLRDVLLSLGVNPFDESSPSNERTKQYKHVHFVGLDGMEASIPIQKAMRPDGDVLLAFAMNDAPLPRQHGFPLRAVVPGHVGVRNVKWVKEIRLSMEEARGPWQRGMAYKGFGPSVKSLEGIDVERIPSLQEQPVQSAITSPSSMTRLVAGDITTVKGYAYSGGGRGIVRVDVSIDGGETWRTATLAEGAEQPIDKAWAWTFWECDFEVPESLSGKQVEIICKATDASYNVQPDTVKGIWNLRGINNNAWHRIKLSVDSPAVDDAVDAE